MLAVVPHHSRSSSPVMRNPDSTKKVSSERTPPAVKYPACTEIANQMVKPRQPSSAGQYGPAVFFGGASITVRPALALANTLPRGWHLGLRYTRHRSRLFRPVLVVEEQALAVEAPRVPAESAVGGRPPGDTAPRSPPGCSRTRRRRPGARARLPDRVRHLAVAAGLTAGMPAARATPAVGTRCHARRGAARPWCLTVDAPEHLGDDRPSAPSSRPIFGGGELARRPSSSATASAPSATRQTPRSVVATTSGPSGARPR